MHVLLKVPGVPCTFDGALFIGAMPPTPQSYVLIGLIIPMGSDPCIHHRVPRPLPAPHIPPKGNANEHGACRSTMCHTT